MSSSYLYSSVCHTSVVFLALLDLGVITHIWRTPPKYINSCLVFETSSKTQVRHLLWRHRHACLSLTTSGCSNHFDKILKVSWEEPRSIIVWDAPQLNDSCPGLLCKYNSSSPCYELTHKLNESTSTTLTNIDLRYWNTLTEMCSSPVLVRSIIVVICQTSVHQIILGCQDCESNSKVLESIDAFNIDRNFDPLNIESEIIQALLVRYKTRIRWDSWNTGALTSTQISSQLSECFIRSTTSSILQSHDSYRIFSGDGSRRYITMALVELRQTTNGSARWGD